MNKKRILTSLFSLTAAAALLVGGTMAFFTDSQTNEDNTFSTGNLAIELDGTDHTGEQIESPFFDVSDMVPGATESAHIEVKNNGSLDLRFRTYTTETENTDLDEDGTFADQLMVTVTLNPTGYSKVLDGSLYGPANTELYSGPLSGLVGVANAQDNHPPADPLGPEFVAVYRVDVTLPSETGNEWQGATFSGDLVVEATQADNQTDPITY